MNFSTANFLTLGVDEAGRGALAGPVVAAAVLLPANYYHPEITDSKKLSPKKREMLRQEILHSAIEWSIAEVDNQTIDKINIAQAAYLAMLKAIQNVKKQYERVLIDGNRFPYAKEIKVPIQCIVRGDSKVLTIAAASILAKTFRDDIMRKLHQEFPIYQWEKNKGYPTKSHKQAILKYGISPYHRKSFKHTL